MTLTSDHIDEQLDSIWIGDQSPNEKLQRLETIYHDVLSLDYPLGIVAVNAIRGRLLTQLGQLSDAMAFLDKAMAQSKPLPPSKWHVMIHSGFAECYRFLGNYEQTFEHYLAGLKIAREINDEKQIIASLGNIGVLQVGLGQYQKAIETFKQVLEAIGETDQLRFNTYLGLTNAYHFLGQYNEAVKIALQALPLAESEISQLQAHGNLGVAYTGAGDYDLAKYHLEQSLHLAERSNAEQSRCICLVDLADYHIKVEAYDQAQALLLECIPLAEALDFNPVLKDCHERLHTIYRQQADWEHALHHHEQMHTIDKNMFNDRVDTRIRNLEVLHNVDQLRRVNELQQREHDALTEVKDTLLSHVSHDLKNPLTTMKATSYLGRRTLIRDMGTDTPYIKYFDRIDKQIDQMTYLITDVLDMARLNTGLKLDLQRIDLSRLVAEVSDEFHIFANAKRITVGANNIENAIYGVIDSRAMHRALENLINNAIKFTSPDGHITIETGEVDNSRVFIRVKDNGIGIPEDELPKIFERFYRVAAHEARKEGTGLGLSIVKSIIEKHHGDIQVDSKLNEGTTFTLILPSSIERG